MAMSVTIARIDDGVVQINLVATADADTGLLTVLSGADIPWPAAPATGGGLPVAFVIPTTAAGVLSGWAVTLGSLTAAGPWTVNKTAIAVGSGAAGTQAVLTVIRRTNAFALPGRSL